MTRRRFLLSGTAGIAGLLLLSTKGFAMFGLSSSSNHGDEQFPFRLSDAEWKEKLSSQAYDVLRHHGTERAFSSPLNDEKRRGVFACAGCGQALFHSDHKFDSGTGWPSFYQPIDGTGGKAVGEREDNRLWMKRTEIHCSNCGGHQGHRFPDGPQPTGLRYCINGVALSFEPL